MTLATLCDYYASLLAYQYRGLPNATRQIRLYAKQMVADFLAGEMLTCFDIDQAVGKQLDTLGKYVGVARNVGIILSPAYFGLWSYGSTFLHANYQGTWNPLTNSPTLSTPGAAGQWYVASASGVSTAPIATTFLAGDILWSDGSAWARSAVDNGNGLTTYSDLDVNTVPMFYSYYDAKGQNTDLSDVEYRTILKLKIVQNSSDGTLASIVAYLAEFFPDEITVTDSLDMTLNYTVLSTLALSQELLTIFLPRPMGVGINVTLVTPPPAGEGVRLVTEGGDVLVTEGGDPIISET